VRRDAALDGIPEASPLDMPGLYAGRTVQNMGASIATTTIAVRSTGFRGDPVAES
jgi:hypothetical protein